MNCKQGDLAIIVRGRAFRKYWGHVVRCKELRGVNPPLWAIDRSLDGHPEYWIMLPDSCLRPLRDGEGIDETLRIVEAPKKTPQPA